ncbi:MAG: hypothetical protein Q8N61_00255 [bacterium]|nr:hypothetical protein [bacterium]
MPFEQEFELKLATGKFVTWNGQDGEEAARRYVDCFRGVKVVAWRWPRHGLFIGMRRILEPGDAGW